MAACTLHAQSLTVRKGIAAPCLTVNTQDVLAIDENHIYLGCSDGRIIVYNHELTQVQSITVFNPISSITNSGETQQYWLYATTTNGAAFNGNYIERYSKTSRTVTGGVLSGLIDEKQIATDKDSNLLCAKVLGTDLVISAIGYNSEINPLVSCAADNTNIYVTSGLQPARIIRGDKEFDFPEQSKYKANSTVVYDHSGFIKAVLSNDQINCAPNVYSDGKVLLRTCGSISAGLLGQGMLLDTVDRISSSSESTWVDIPFASAATTVSVGETKYIIVGTQSGMIKVLKLVVGTEPTAVVSVNLYSVFNHTALEKAYDRNRKFLLETDLMVQSVMARNNTVVVLTRPRWPQLVRASYFADTPRAASPTLSVYTIK